MKILKGFFTFITSVILTTLLLVLSLNLVLKNVVEKEVLGGIIKDNVIKEYVENENVENKEEIKQLLNDKQATKIAEYVISDYMEYLSDNSHQVSEKTVDSILEFCVKHRTEISKISGREVPESEITSPETKENLTKTLNEGFAKVGKDINENALDAIKEYNNFTSKNFMIIMTISITISILVIAVIKNSLYKWLSTFGAALLSCGLMISTIYVLINIIISSVKENIELDININLNGILIIGLTEVIVGITCIIIKKVIDKSKNIKVKPKEVQPVLQQEQTSVSEEKNKINQTLETSSIDNKENNL